MHPLDAIRRLPLAHLPTPLEPAPRLGAALGLPQLWVKRDDCTGLAMGGNKARKLEYLVADAVAQGATVLITTGGVQSNHARMTAAAACRLGMRALLFLSDDPPPEPQGNLVLDRLFGAEVRFLPDARLSEVDTAMAEAARDLAALGEIPYIIPVGGSTSRGCLGYARAVRELAEQVDGAQIQPAAMVAAVGSCGTLAGLMLGGRCFLPHCQVVGISVSPPAARARTQAARIATDAASLLGVAESFGPEDCLLFDDWLGPGYGIPTPASLAAIAAAARTEGLILDPVYTGKALAGVRGLAERGVLSPDASVVFWHTGGAPALFAFADLMREEAMRTTEDARQAQTRKCKT
ncbi:MAG: D-cysteine desulfhydrase family protein [Armatimonadetes bacterium]|nr:D-cysteine desulfhydrase family protein [Armatimonadota bacterium]